MTGPDADRRPAAGPSGQPPMPVGFAWPTDLADLVARVTRRPARLIWLWAVWMLLWGRLTPLAAISGLLVAVAILVAFPFRAIDPDRRFRLLPALRLLAYLLIDILPSALKVAWQMIRYGPRVRSAIVAVPLSTRSEVATTLTANAVSLAPGTFVVEVDHDAEVMYVHTLPVADDRAMDRTRAHVLNLECRVLRAFGTTEDAEAADLRRKEYP